MRRCSGFTLLEVLLAGSIMSFILFSSVLFLQQSTAVSNKSAVINTVYAQGVFIEHTLRYEMGRTREVALPLAGATSTSVTLINDVLTEDPVVIEQSGAQLLYTAGLLNPSSPLHNDEVALDSFQINHQQTTNLHSLVTYTFTLSASSTSLLQEYSYSQTFTGSIHVRNYEL